jgi:hypothetical protein
LESPARHKSSSHDRVDSERSSTRSESRKPILCWTDQRRKFRSHTTLAASYTTEWKHTFITTDEAKQNQRNLEVCVSRWSVPAEVSQSQLVRVLLDKIEHLFTPFELAERGERYAGQRRYHRRGHSWHRSWPPTYRKKILKPYYEGQCKANKTINYRCDNEKKNSWFGATSWYHCVAEDYRIYKKPVILTLSSSTCSSAN